MKTWFITGVGRGLGAALAEAVLARGDAVIGTVRTATTADLSRNGLELITLDLSEEPITPNRVSGFRHGAEAIAARLDDDAGSDINTDFMQADPAHSAGYTEHGRERKRRLEQTVNSLPELSASVGHDGPIDRLARSPPGPIPPQTVRCPVGTLDDTRHC